MTARPADLSREDIRNLIWCPICHVAAGDPCVHRGKGSAKKMRLGINHHERAVAAHALRIAGGRLTGRRKAPLDPLFEDFA